MAAAQSVNIDELFECPVCYDSYTDPRILQCAHQFCLKCLLPLVIKKPPALDRITCPTCRHDTPIKSGEEARHLPRPVLMNEVQSALQNLIGSTMKTIKKQCDLCEEENITATNYCYQCHQNMCDSCLSDHKDMSITEGHQTVTISDSLFCQTHNNIVTVFCHQCKIGICMKCAMQDHKKHKTEDIHGMANNSLLKVKELIKKQESTQLNQATLTSVKNVIEKLQTLQDSIVSRINRIFALLKFLETQLVHTQKEVLAKTSADIKTFKMYEADLQNLFSSQASLVDLGKYLIEKASEPELVVKSFEFAAASTLQDRIDQPPKACIPDDKDLCKLETSLTELTGLCAAKYEKEFSISHFNVKEKTEPLSVAPVTASWSPHRFSAFDSEGLINVPAFGAKERAKPTPKSINWTRVFISEPVINPKLSQVAVKADGESSVKIFDFKGALVKNIGERLHGAVHNIASCIDHLRQLLLTPQDENLLLTPKGDGAYDSICVKGSDLRGAAYSVTKDLYIVTDCRNHRVVIIDAESRKVVNSFGSYGLGDCHFIKPYNVCVGDIEGRSRHHFGQ